MLDIIDNKYKIAYLICNKNAKKIDLVMKSLLSCCKTKMPQPRNISHPVLLVSAQVHQSRNNRMN